MHSRLFSKFNDIELESKEPWSGRVFLLFDIDWASDEVLSFTADLVESFGVSAIWFVTHDTPLLSRLRGNRRFELGIHPNFNNLLEGTSSIRNNSKQIIQRLHNIVPEAISVRSHSLTQNSRLSHQLYQMGYKFDINTYIHPNAISTVKPWIDFTGIIKIPFIWEDDIHCVLTNNGIKSYSPLQMVRDLDRTSPLVFAFHPIHVFLNTEKLERYETAKEIGDDFSALKSLVAPAQIGGTRDLLIELLETILKN